MAERHLLTYDDAGGATPYTITLTPDQDIRLFSVRCKVNGSGAASSFYPTLALVSPDGKIVSRTRPETSFAAGDTGEVTFAPFLHSEGAAPVVSTIVPLVGTKAGPVNHVARLTVSPGQDPLALTGDTADFIRWPQLSPDGTLIVYNRNETLRTVEPDGTNDTLLLDLSGTAETPDSITWTPDSAKVVFIKRFGANEHKLYTINRDGTGETVLYTDGASRPLGYPSYSYDGVKIAFLRNVAAAVNEIWVANADGTGAAAVVSVPTQFSGIRFDNPTYAWQNTARRFAYNGNTLAAPHWKAVNDDGSNIVTVKTFTGAVGNPTWRRWSADDAFLYGVKQTDASVLEKYAADGSSTTQVYDHTAAFGRGAVYLVGGRFYLREPGNADIDSLLPDGTDFRLETAGAVVLYNLL